MSAPLTRRRALAAAAAAALRIGAQAVAVVASAKAAPDQDVFRSLADDVVRLFGGGAA